MHRDVSAALQCRGISQICCAVHDTLSQTLLADNTSVSNVQCRMKKVNAELASLNARKSEVQKNICEIKTAMKSFCT